MYLKRLYKYHKGWFAFVVLFAAAELFICFKRGVVLTPFLQYGMYSSVQKPAESYTAPLIIVNKRILHTSTFSGYAWDKLTIPLDAFRSEREWNRRIWTTNISRMLHLRDSTPYVNPPLGGERFADWYKACLPNIIHEPVSSLFIPYITYCYDSLSRRHTISTNDSLFTPYLPSPWKIR